MSAETVEHVIGAHLGRRIDEEVNRFLVRLREALEHNTRRYVLDWLEAELSDSEVKNIIHDAIQPSVRGFGHQNLVRLRTDAILKSLQEKL